jgi:hypothetical protein
VSVGGTGDPSTLIASRFRQGTLQRSLETTVVSSYNTETILYFCLLLYNSSVGDPAGNAIQSDRTVSPGGFQKV